MGYRGMSFSSSSSSVVAGWWWSWRGRRVGAAATTAGTEGRRWRGTSVSASASTSSASALSATATASASASASGGWTRRERGSGRRPGWGGSGTGESVVFGACAFGFAGSVACEEGSAAAGGKTMGGGAEAPPTSNKSTAQWRIYTDMGRGLVQEKKYDEARRYLERALLEAKKGFGEKDPHVAAALNNLAELNRIERKWGESESLFAQALEILREAFGETHPAVGTALHNLAGCRLAQDDVDGAYNLYAKSLERKEATLGINHPEYATTLYHMAEVLCRNGRKSDAIVLLERSIKVSEEIGAAHTDACLRRLKRLAQLLWDCEEYERAERVRRRILDTLEHMVGEDHVKIAGACESLALVLMKLDHLDEAKTLLERGASILSRTRGDGSGLALTSARLHLAEVAWKRGNAAESLRLIRQVVDVLAPAALDAVRRDGIRPEVRVGITVQYAKAARLFRNLAPNDEKAENHVENATQNLQAIETVAKQARVGETVEKALADLVN